MKKFGDPFAQLCTVLYIVLYILQYNSVALDATLESSNCSLSFSPNSQIFGSHMTVSRQARPGPGIVSSSAKESTLALSQVHPALPQVDLTSIRKQFCTQCIVTVLSILTQPSPFRWTLSLQVQALMWILNLVGVYYPVKLHKHKATE